MFKSSTNMLDRPLPAIPPLETVSEEYSEIYAKLMDLYRRQRDLRAKSERMNEVLRDRASRGRYSDLGENDLVNDRVAAILGESIPDEPRTLSLDERVKLLAQEEADVQQAVYVVQRRLEAARLDASVKACEVIEPELREVISALSEKMAEVTQLASRYRKFADHLNAANVAWSHMEVMSIDAGGVLNRSSPFVLWLIAASERGFVDPSKLARELRQ